MWIVWIWNFEPSKDTMALWKHSSHQIYNRKCHSCKSIPSDRYRCIWGSMRSMLIAHIICWLWKAHSVTPKCIIGLQTAFQKCQRSYKSATMRKVCFISVMYLWVASWCASIGKFFDQISFTPNYLRWTSLFSISAKVRRLSKQRTSPQYRYWRIFSPKRQLNDVLNWKSYWVILNAFYRRIFVVPALNPLCLVDVNRTSVSFVIDLIEAKLKKHISIQDEHQTLNSLIDLDIQDDGELNSLGTKYTGILERKHKIIEAFNASTHMLDSLVGFIVSLYVDYHKMKGIDVHQNVPGLKQLIRNYDNQTLINFMLGDSPEIS